MRLLFILFICFLSFSSRAKKNVSISIDDVPNTTLFSQEGFKSTLLHDLDSLQIPMTIFINESKLFQNEFVIKNMTLFEEWVSKPYITLGNHSYSHARYSDLGFESYKEEILKGETITKALAKRYDKVVQYFRFPYNDLGLDSIQHQMISDYLATRGYVIAPFTIESSDWVFNYLYEYYLENGDLEQAKRVGQEYIENTLLLFDFYDSLSVVEYGRSIDQIYLCHDNKLNADYLSLLVDQLKKRDYAFISFEQAMLDVVYRQDDIYYKKWGVSWMYRWLNGIDRKAAMQQEPALAEVYKAYEEVQKKR